MLVRIFILFMLVGGLVPLMGKQVDKVNHFLVPSATQLVRQITSDVTAFSMSDSLSVDEVDKLLNRFIKNSTGNKGEGNKLEKKEVYYLTSLFLRYVVRGELVFLGARTGRDSLDTLKDRWVDKALRLAKKSVDADLDDIAEGKVIPPDKYLSNLASIYAIKVTYSSFPFLISYVKKLQKIIDLAVKKEPMNFEFRVARVVNYSVSSYTFYKEGKDKLDKDMVWLEKQYPILQKKYSANSNSKENKKVFSRLLDLMNHARLASGTYYFKEVEDKAVAKQWLEKLDFNLPTGEVNLEWKSLLSLRKAQQKSLLQAIRDD